MISSKEDLKRYLSQERKLYDIWDKKESFINTITSDVRLYTWKFIKAVRMCEYFKNTSKLSMFRSILYLFWRRRKNVIGRKLGIEAWENSIEEGLLIYHPGNIVINGNSKIGKNLKLHGNNCIGNNGKTQDCPVIGDNVELGVGAKIIGKVCICDNVLIGAGCVVVNDIVESGTYVGIPAHKVK